MISKEQHEYLLRQVEFVFSTPDFLKPKIAKEIIAPIPDEAQFEEKRRIAIRSMPKGVALSVAAPCYHGALLNSAQELHLFRKYNYYKMLMRKLLSGGFTDRRQKRYQEAQNLFDNVVKPTKHLLIESNARLSVNVAKKFNRHIFDQLVEEGYITITICVDRFDWRKGNKFSTYTMWAIKNSFCREYHKNVKDLENLVAFNPLSHEKVVSDIDLEAIHNLERAKTIKGLLHHVTDEEDAYVIKSTYGIDGYKGKAPSELREELGVSKQRIQQRKQKAIQQMRYGHLKMEFDPNKTILIDSLSA